MWSKLVALVLGVTNLAKGSSLQSTFSAHESASLPVAEASRWCDPELSARLGTETCWTRYIDLETDTSWSYLFPVSDRLLGGGEPVTEFIGSLSAPASAGWIGSTLGSSAHDPVIIGWLDSNVNPMLSIRQPDLYLPLLGSGPKLTILSRYSGLTSSGHLRLTYRCQNCTSWEGKTGAIDVNGPNVFNFSAHTTSRPSRPSSPSNPTSGVEPPNLTGQYVFEVPSAKSELYWEVLATLE